ncbi:hypothetical protein [Aureliella helgolandensis]|uniref:Uncharacterized protein n=1 Tax=Aureliella helgolandensis TaxID=2527968 RepID=A0A518GDH4_9BACT|nr:hypothetical protein [Aureliella helgolandensis]QDV26655.1 hypothetical protein Q31a_50310 [Aureliella helgolandensis]
MQQELTRCFWANVGFTAAIVRLGQVQAVKRVLRQQAEADGGRKVLFGVGDHFAGAALRAEVLTAHERQAIPAEDSELCSTLALLILPASFSCFGGCPTGSAIP